ncbi:hypothetical protein HRbin08_00930 [bacterium HR08]|nr:hypothetical protein HRbin08_00930 [bacterium HR08]
MTERTMEQAPQTQGRLTTMGKRLGALTSAAGDLWAGNMRLVKRGVQRGLWKVEDWADEAVLYIRRHPYRVLGLALGSGFAVGVLLGARFGRK